MFNFANWPIQKKINLISVASAIVVFFLVFETFSMLRSVDINNQTLKKITDIQVSVEHQNTNVQAIGHRFHEYLFNFDDRQKSASLAQSIREYLKSFKETQDAIFKAKDLGVINEQEYKALEGASKDFVSNGEALLLVTSSQNFRDSYENFDKTLDTFIALLEPLSKKLDDETTSIEQNSQESIAFEKLILMLSGILGILFTAAGFSYVGRKISLSIAKVVSDVNELSNGNYGLDIQRVETTEEIGSLINASYKLRESVERSVTLQSVIDRLAMSVMMCDKDYKIVYANKKAVDTLRTIEHLLPIKVDNLIGTNIDIFHKNPAHQRGLLADSSRLPHNAKFNIGPETMRLSANILQDYNGRFNGAFIDWDIITAQVKAEEAVQQAQAQIKNVIQAVREGDLNARVNVEQFEGYYRELAQGMNELVHTVKEPIDRSIESLTRLSQGDLMARMEGEYNGDFKAIQTSLNATIDKLKSVVFEIRQSSESVTSASTEISSGSTDLSMRTEQQASSLEETAASMEELTKAVRNNTETSSKASSLAQEAERNAEEGGQVANNAVKAMNEIEASSSKMADIIGVIDEIAFQINLLALNAAVEAARAGDAGKGFAVVASEVRALAGRSAAASKEIRELISTSTEQVASGAGLVKSAGDALNKILGSIKEVSKLMSEIAGASKEQAQGIEEVNSAVAQMDEMTQQNAALVEENTAAAQSLVDLASGLTKLITFFSVNDNEAADGAAHLLLNSEKRSAAHKISPPKPTNSNTSKAFEKPANKNPKPAAPKKAASTSGGGAKAGAYNEGWEEF